uniref:NADH dehydrogenase subunit 4L n=2 Tax=RTA clade TaxID=94020 RepID=A0A0E3DRE8_ARGAQ|nr:NADH dehydrogenase subunit 4L [Argyroneta aquatica]AIL95163.1 NADH dehydrogenase subunit 4L [Argyroneta aquatica]QNV11920.1 NADH dehydrogenase subunit 4L [Pisaura mirabilis]
MTLMKLMMYISILSMCWWRKTIIMLLLSLELLLISLFLSLSINNQFSQISLFSMLVMMTAGSSIGLSMLVSLSHSHNSSNSIFINMMT